MFLDGPDGGPRDAIHVLIANEKVRTADLAPTPGVERTARPAGFFAIDLESLVQMKLTSYRRKDQVHLLDMLEIGLIDGTWVRRFPPELAARLQLLIDTPD